MSVEKLVFSHKGRVCLDEKAGPGDSAVLARQLDAVLMSAGYKMAGDLLHVMSRLDFGYVFTKAAELVGWAREAKGAHVEHNAYFIDFPANVPDTFEFWAGLLRDAVMAVAQGGEAEVRVALGPQGEFALDLLSLPGYGTYQHSYAEMAERHAPFEALLRDKFTIVHLGTDPDTEGLLLLNELAETAVPLSGQKLDDLRVLAAAYAGDPRVVRDVPVRENQAVLGAARARAGYVPVVRTSVTDVLRIAAELSGSDVTLATAPKFASFPRKTRLALMVALDALLEARPQGVEDVLRYPEEWKRLAERLHPHEYPGAPAAQHAFAVARGETSHTTRAGRAEAAFAAGKPAEAARELASAPGEFWRQVDRMLRSSTGPAAQQAVLKLAGQTAPHVSGRVLLSVREHLLNRVQPNSARIFPVRSGRAWVTRDVRDLLNVDVVRELCQMIDAEVAGRLGGDMTIVVDPAILGAALPLSGKAQTEGLGVWPRGSVSKLDGAEWLRFFFYWKESGRTTDYDLSAMFVNEDFKSGTHISYTNLRSGWAQHSGDLTSAPNGATEFINIELDRVPKGQTVIPQLYLYNGGYGETFDALAENFFGYMTLSPEQKGLPYEARPVRMKTVLAGEARAVMPVVFYRGDDGAWYAKWLHLQLRGTVSGWGGYRVEENKLTTELMAQMFMARHYIQVRYLAGAFGAAGNTVIMARGNWREQAGDRSLTYIGLDRPEGLPEGSEVYTLANLPGLIPA